MTISHLNEKCYGWVQCLVCVFHLKPTFFLENPTFVENRKREQTVIFLMGKSFFFWKVIRPLTTWAWHLCGSRNHKKKVDPTPDFFIKWGCFVTGEKTLMPDRKALAGTYVLYSKGWVWKKYVSKTFSLGSCFEGRLSSPSNTLQWLLTSDDSVLLCRVDCHMEKTRWLPCYVACHAWGVWGFKGNRQGNTALCTKIGCCLWFFWNHHDL